MARLIGQSLLALGLLLALPAAVAAADPGDIGFEGPAGPGGAPTGSKPESKLWYNDGHWWAVIYDDPADTGDLFIFRLDGNTWVRTGAALTTEGSYRSDVLWDGTKLYVAIHRFSEGDGSGNSRLYRFSYNAATDTHTLDGGFPGTINSVRSEALVIAKDSTGQLWATWDQGTQIMVNQSTNGGSTWGTPFQLPGSTTIDGDDVASIIAFGGNRIGVLYSNQSIDRDVFIVHNDSAADTSWLAPETAYSGSNSADDHVNLKTSADGRVFAAVKTSRDSGSPNDIITLLARSTGGTWTSHVVSVNSLDHTRPIVVIDETNNLLRVFYTNDASGGSINEKTSSLSSISFPSGDGTPVIRDADDEDVNNVTSTKQNVTSASGLVIMAYQDSTRRYWHANVLAGGGNVPPTANPVNVATAQNTPAPVTLSGTDPETCQLTFSIVTQPAHGTLGSIANNACVAGSPNSDSASVTYTPTSGYSGPDSFTYRVNDGTANSAAATVSISVAASDTTAPVRGATAINGASLTIDWNEPLNASSVPAASAFSVSVNGTARTINQVAIADARLTLTLGTPVDDDDVVTVSYAIPATNRLEDLAGNAAEAFANAAVINNTPGAVTSLTFQPVEDAQVKSTSPTNNYGTATTIRLRQSSEIYQSFLKFNVAGLTGPVTGVKLRLFVTDPSPDSGTVFSTSSAWTESTLTWNNKPALGTARGTAGTTTTEGTWVEVTLDPASVAGDGTVAFGMSTTSTNSAIFSSSEGTNPPELVVTFGTAPPADTTAPVAGTPAVDAATLTIGYDEALDAGSVPAAGDFTVTAGASPVAVSTVGISGSTVTLGLAAPVAFGQSVELDYVPGTNPIQDAAGNDAAALTDVAVTNNTPEPDTTAPIAGTPAVDAATLTIGYDEALDPASVPAGTDFTVTAGGSPVSVSTVGISGSTVTLGLAAPVAFGQSVELDYVPGTNPIQDAAGNDAAALTDVAVTNNTPEPDTTAPVAGTPAVDGATLTIPYDEALDGASVPAAGDFTVTAGGSPVSVSIVGISGSTVTLGLAAPVAFGQSVELDYVPGTNPIQDAAGNPAAALTDVAVTNNTPNPDPNPPVRSGAPTVDGSTLTIGYDETLDAGSVPDTTAFAVTVAGGARALSGVAISGSNVVLTLASPVVAGQAVTVAYTAPGANPVKDLAGNPAASFGATAVTNATAPTGSTSLTFTPAEDAQVKSTSPANNYGNLTTIRLRESSEIYRTFLKFDVAGLTAPVTGVTLRLFVTDASPDSGRVFTTTNGWAEGTITWNNQPAMGTTVLGTAGATTTTGTWLEITLDPSSVTGNGTVSFGMTTTSTNSAIFSSSEGTNPPELVVAFGS